MGHLPFNSGFDPGPAYNGFGPNPISFNSVTAAVLAPGTPVYGAPAPMGDAFGVDPNLRTPYMENFNLNFQQQLGSGRCCRLDMSGRRGISCFGSATSTSRGKRRSMRTITGRMDAACRACLRRRARILHQLRRELGEFELQRVTDELAGERLARRDLDGELHVVALDRYGERRRGFCAERLAAERQDESRGGNRGNSNFDVRNRFTWNFIYQFPNRHGDWKKLTDGWGINGIVTVQSGQPFQLNYNFEDDYDGSGEFFGRPDVVGPVHTITAIRLTF